MFLAVLKFHSFTLSMMFYLASIFEASFETMSNHSTPSFPRKKHYPDFRTDDFQNIFILGLFTYKSIKYLELVYIFKTLYQLQEFLPQLFVLILFFILSNIKITHIQNTHTQRSSLDFIWLSFICHTKISFNNSNKTMLIYLQFSYVCTNSIS